MALTLKRQKLCVWSTIWYKNIREYLSQDKILSNPPIYRTKAGEAEPTMLALTNQPHEMSRSERTFHRYFSA